MDETRTPETTAEAPPAPRKKQRRGFAAMDPSKQKAIASKGGQASHKAGTGHEWSSEAARNAGRKGGLASRGGRGRPTPEPTKSPTLSMRAGALRGSMKPRSLSPGSIQPAPV
ncbi:MAG: stress protein [Deltaproteobacteria bacterium]|nr:stress protein [Deltaproteobacteria bacterium]